MQMTSRRRNVFMFDRERQQKAYLRTESWDGGERVFSCLV